MPARPHNRLDQETSPYLRQHAANPVAWQPWDAEALALARDSGRPILLSIGYSACHWCHVMAHECFEDPAIAEVMNELFVNIKVDREERPDLDKVYQTAHAALTRRAGGWPLTVFLTPDEHMPFFAGTYFPPEPRHGLPGFAELLRQIAAAYRERDADIQRQNQALREMFDRLGQAPGAAALPAVDELIGLAIEEALQQADPQHGGFGQAPKFPHPSLVEFILREWQTGHPRDTGTALGELAGGTLQGMYRGGLFDHLGGGFFRYSVDARWCIPHFEKMLYDNGPLLAVYSQAYAATGKPEFMAAASATAAWAVREMQSPEGGFHATLDADSEGEEGRYYLWRPEQVRALLPAAEYAVFGPAYGLDGPANFESREWHLQRSGVESESTSLETEARIDAARARLLAARESRVRPDRDDKIIAAWNGLMIRGLARAARHLELPEYLDAARAAMDCVRRRLWRDDRLYSVYTDGQARFPAYLDDHAFVLEACLELLQLRWDSGLLDFATTLAERLLADFQDTGHGGFFFTAADQEIPLYRPKPFTDESIPAGNGIAAQALIGLGFLLGRQDMLDAAEGCLRGGAESLTQSPLHHASLLRALQWLQAPPEIIILRGAPAAMAEWRRRLDAGYRPDRLVFSIEAGTPNLPPALATKAARGDCVAYRCVGWTCSEPWLQCPE